MAKKQKTEKTPKGATIPVPRRDDFLANLKKVAKIGRKPASDGRTQK